MTRIKIKTGVLEKLIIKSLLALLMAIIIVMSAITIISYRIDNMYYNMLERGEIMQVVAPKPDGPGDLI